MAGGNSQWEAGNRPVGGALTARAFENIFRGEKILAVKQTTKKKTHLYYKRKLGKKKQKQKLDKIKECKK